MISQASKIIALVAFWCLLTGVTGCESQNNLQNVPIVVSGRVIPGSGGEGTKCPGEYKGHVDFISQDPSGGWYFRNGGQAYDSVDPSNTVVYHSGVPYTNYGCSSSSNTANIPKSEYPYHFIIFFKNTVPSGTYELTMVTNS
jgi:hypothetical protein